MWFWRYLLETYRDFLRLVYLWEMLSEQTRPMLADAFCFDRRLLRLRYEQELSYQLRKSLAAMASSTLLSPLASGPK